MFWNTGLYYYHQIHGGTFLGLSQEDEPNATLLLPDEKGVVELCPVLRGFTRYNTNWDAAARLSVTLERPFTLRVKPENDLRWTRGRSCWRWTPSSRRTTATLSFVSAR